VGWILRNGSGSQDEGPRKQTQGIPSSTRNLYFPNQYFHKQEVPNTIRLYVPCGPHAQAECRRGATQKMEARHQKTGTTRPPTHQMREEAPTHQPSPQLTATVLTSRTGRPQHPKNPNPAHPSPLQGGWLTQDASQAKQAISSVPSGESGGSSGGVHPSGNARTGQSSQLA
jgi:hypothetical protein